MRDFALPLKIILSGKYDFRKQRNAMLISLLFGDTLFIWGSYFTNLIFSKMESSLCFKNFLIFFKTNYEVSILLLIMCRHAFKSAPALAYYLTVTVTFPLVWVIVIYNRFIINLIEHLYPYTCFLFAWVFWGFF